MNSWEPINNILDDRLIKEFEKNQIKIKASEFICK